MTAPVLEIDDLRITAPDGADLVAGASLVVGDREFVGVVGESGSGKSLLLRAITGLLPAGVAVTAGRIAFDGREVTDPSSLRGDSVGMVFQEPMTALNPMMRIGRQISEGPIRHRGISRREASRLALDLLDRVGIREPARCAEQYPHEMSGGMRQRAMIATALASRPRLLLCDEPTTALDATLQRQVLELLMELRSELGIAIVLVTHDLGVVARACDRVSVMYAGRMVETGPVQDVLNAPRHFYTLSLLAAVPKPGGSIDELRPIAGAPPAPSDRPRGCAFHPRCDAAEETCRHDVPPTWVDGERTTACRRHAVLAKAAELLPHG